MSIDKITIIGTTITIMSFGMTVFTTEWSIELKVLAIVFSILSLAGMIVLYFKHIRSKELKGTFEWQWAGENWIGKLEIQSKANGKVQFADLQMNSVVKTNNESSRSYERLLLFQSSTPGTVVTTKNGLKIRLPVLAYNDVEGITNSNEIRTLEGELKLVKAYAGQIKYVYPDGSNKSGDMILVDYKSTF